MEIVDEGSWQEVHIAGWRQVEECLEKMLMQWFRSEEIARGSFVCLPTNQMSEKQSPEKSLSEAVTSNGLSRVFSSSARGHLQKHSKEVRYIKLGYMLITSIDFYFNSIVLVEI